jgi:hypothetical protein
VVVLPRSDRASLAAAIAALQADRLTAAYDQHPELRGHRLRGKGEGGYSLGVVHVWLEGPILAQLVLNKPPASGTPWASIFESIGGVATAGALLVSLLLLRQQLANQKRADQDRRRLHASHISFWLEYNGSRSTAVAGLSFLSVRMHIMNTSLQPAMSVLALVGLRIDVWRDASAEQRVAEWSRVAIAPGEDVIEMITLQVESSVSSLVHDRGASAIIGELLFTDSAGVPWVRTQSGDLLDRDSHYLASLNLADRDERRRQPSASQGSCAPM